MLSHIAESMLSKEGIARFPPQNGCKGENQDFHTCSGAQFFRGGVIWRVSQIGKFPSVLSEDHQCQCPQQGLRGDRGEGEVGGRC